MRFVQFYQRSTGYVPGSIPPKFDPAQVQPIAATGDRGVMIIDQRIRAKSAGEIAATECKNRGFIGWRMFEGSSFSQCRPVSGYWPCAGKPDNSAASATYGA